MDTDKVDYRMIIRSIDYLMFRKHFIVDCTNAQAHLKTLVTEGENSAGKVLILTPICIILSTFLILRKGDRRHF